MCDVMRYYRYAGSSGELQDGRTNIVWLERKGMAKLPGTQSIRREWRLRNKWVPSILGFYDMFLMRIRVIFLGNTSLRQNVATNGNGFSDFR